MFILNNNLCKILYIYYSEELLDDGSNNVETLRLTEGTVILHISFAVKEHQDLGREFIKCIKVCHTLS